MYIHTYKLYIHISYSMSTAVAVGSGHLIFDIYFFVMLSENYNFSLSNLNFSVISNKTKIRNSDISCRKFSFSNQHYKM